MSVSTREDTRAREHTRVTSAAIVLAALTGCIANVDPEAIDEPAVERNALTLQQHIDTCNADPRVIQGLVPLDVCVGAELFFREPFGGNGRTCASCHPVANNYALDPSFIDTLPASDPLFIAEQVPALAQLEKPTLMRDFGLILENADGMSSPTTRFTMRSVPHCFSMETSIVPPSPLNDGTTLPPNERTGWSGDGAPNAGELRDFQTGAIIQHYPKTLARATGSDFVLATSAELDKIRAFLGKIGRTNELALSSITLTDSGAETGRALFLAPTTRCNGCHNNAGANNAAGFNRNFNTGVERARIAQLNTLGIPFDGGFGGASSPSFDFDASGDGILDSFGNGGFNTPPLIEAADTGPFFHTNAFETIEDAIEFYTTPAFRDSPAGGGNAVPLSATEIANLGRFLRVLNAAFNAQIAIARVNGVIPIIIEEKNHLRELQQELAALAREEVDDALAMLSQVASLNTSTQTQLTTARTQLVTASTHSSHTQRRQAAEAALTALTAANGSLTTTPAAMTFTMGKGLLMF